MPVSIHLRGDDLTGPVVANAVRAAFAELALMDRLFSTWDEQSQLRRHQRGELPLADADPLLAQADELGRQAEELTGGSFTTRLPDSRGRLVFDPTGLVKGWAVDRASTALTVVPGLSWCVNAGGDVLVGRHRHVPPVGNAAAAWRIGVEDPRDRSRIQRVVPLVAGAVATSGIAARGAHLYDPSARRMVTRSGAQTVVGSSLLWADVWATALFVGGPAAVRAFATHAPGAQTFAA